MIARGTLSPEPPGRGMMPLHPHKTAGWRIEQFTNGMSQLLVQGFSRKSLHEIGIGKLCVPLNAYFKCKRL